MDILVIGGGIGGLTAAIALRRQGFDVTVIEKESDWTVYGVGIIQQGNVLRAMNSLGLLERYVNAGAGFDALEIYAPDGTKVARLPSPRLLEDQPATLGIGRPALHRVLIDAATTSGAAMSLGTVAESIDDTGRKLRVGFSNGSEREFDLVIGADGVHSQVRASLFPEAGAPQFTGQAVWRYNLPRPPDLDAMHVYNGPIGTGLVPISADLMYIYATTPEPDNPRCPREGLAAAFRGKLAGCAPAIRAVAEQITDDTGVVYRPLEWLLVEGPWHKGRVVLLGDAAHSATPHLGQGAGLAIEDALVLADELARHGRLEDALRAYRERRFDRCAYVVHASLAICMGQLGKGPPVDNARAAAEMFDVVARPI